MNTPAFSCLNRHVLTSLLTPPLTLMMLAPFLASSGFPSESPHRLQSVSSVENASSVTVVILASPPVRDELTRFASERERATQRADGSPLVAIRREEFLLLIERSLLPDDLTAARVAALEALRREWRPGVAISLAGASGAAYVRGVVSQLPPGSRPLLYASGGFQIERSSEVVMTSGGRRTKYVSSTQTRLSDEVYPPGSGAQGKASPAANDLKKKLEPIASEAVQRPLVSSRFAEVLDPATPATQARGFDRAFSTIAERWKRDEEMLKEKYGDLDRALDADLASRDRIGSPKAGTKFGDLDRKSQARILDDLKLNYKFNGFDSPEAAGQWLATAKVERVVKRDYCGFGVWDQGRGGQFVQIQLFRP